MLLTQLPADASTYCPKYELTARTAPGRRTCVLSRNSQTSPSAKSPSSAETEESEIFIGSAAEEPGVAWLDEVGVFVELVTTCESVLAFFDSN